MYLLGYTIPYMYSYLYYYCHHKQQTLDFYPNNLISHVFYVIL